MSAIDRAFVKAFAKQRERPAPAALGPGKAESPREPARTLSVDSPHAVVPPPHARFVKRAADHEGASQSKNAHSTLSGNISEAPKVAPADQHPLEPAFEVDRFAWPDVCRTLRERSAAQLNRLVDALKSREHAAEASTVLVTACQAGEGRSTVLLSLALGLAENHLRVVLIDADFASAGLAQRLGVAPLVGFDDVIGKSVSAAEAMIESIADAVTLVPLRSVVDSSSDLVNHPRWHAALAALRRQYDVVLIGGAPLFRNQHEGQSDPGIGSIGVDMAVLVYDARVTSPEMLEGAVGALETDEIKSLVIVENFVYSPATHAA